MWSIAKVIRCTWFGIVYCCPQNRIVWPLTSFQAHDQLSVQTVWWLFIFHCLLFAFESFKRWNEFTKLIASDKYWTETLNWHLTPDLAIRRMARCKIVRFGWSFYQLHYRSVASQPKKRYDFLIYTWFSRGSLPINIHLSISLCNALADSSSRYRFRHRFTW